MDHDEAAGDKRRKNDTEGKGDGAIDDQPIREPIGVLDCPGNSELAKC